MAKKNQLSAAELIESFKNQFYYQLSIADRKYCDRIISQGLNEQEITKILPDYIDKECRVRDLDLSPARELASRIENYSAVFNSLLLSYSPQKNASARIPERYYKPAPRSLGMTLVALPHHNIIIRIEKHSNEAWYGTQRNKAGALLSIKVFKKENEWRLMYDGSYIDTQYPRYSMTCHVSSECRANVDITTNFLVRGRTSIMHITECMMSPNRSKVCPLEAEYTKAHGMGLSDFLALVLMCYDRWQNRPISLRTKKWESYSDMGVSILMPKTPQWEHISEGFREIQLRDYTEFVEQARASGFRVENRASPCEHERRGHMRTLKDGRKVYVRPSIVNKGGEKIVYRVTG
jgi:hypothetical protein